ncbi:hypothetical protein ACFZCY_14505 [Streptomyces sp. NPDC007983]|uniref:hypothetical protein n=1 Tax=Streptomyces sp. NPDC007983 TaxID=3364800 RepID=UPI0036E44EED
MIGRTGGVDDDDAQVTARAAWAAARPAGADALLWAVLMAVGVLWYADRARSSLATGLLLPALVLAVAVPGSRRRPSGAVFLVNGLCALGLASPDTPANAYLLSLAVLSCLLATRSLDTRAALRVCSAAAWRWTSGCAPYCGRAPFTGSTP